MKKYAKYLIIAVIAIIVIPQLIPVDRSNPPVTSEIEAPAEVMTILKASCYDCHSNETVWPWYSYIAPVSWLVAHDVEEGRQELNFSEWDQVTHQASMIHEAVEEIEEGEMPLPKYLLTHPDAAITEQQLATLKAWVDSTMNTPAANQDHE